MAIGAAQGREGAAVETVFAARVPPLLVQLDEDRFLGDRAVFAVGVLVGDAGEPLVADVGTADAPGFQIGIAVGLGSGVLARKAFGGGAPGGNGRRRDVVVVGLALHPIDVEGEVSIADGHASEGAAAVVHAGRLGGDHAGHATLGDFGGDAVVQNIDHAANGRAAIDQHRGPANDLDTIGLGRIGGDGMVG